MTDQVIASKTFNCRICGKSYKHQPALSTHQSKCLINKTCEDQAETIKQQAETIKHLTATIAKLMASPNTQSTQNVVIDLSNNIAIDKIEFNIETFLYETCKKAPTYEKFTDILYKNTLPLEDIALSFIKGNKTIQGLTTITMDNLFKGISISPFYNVDMKNMLCVKKHNQKTWIYEIKGEEGEDDYSIPEMSDKVENVFKRLGREFSTIVDIKDKDLFPNGIIDYENARDDLTKIINKKNLLTIIEKTVARHPKIQLPNAIKEVNPPIEECEEVNPPIEECENVIIEVFPPLEEIDD